MNDPIAHALAKAIRPLLDQHRAAIRADLREIISQMVAAENSPVEAAAFNARSAAKYLGISPRTVHRWRTLGRLRAVKIGGAVRYRRVDLDRLLTELSDPDSLITPANQCPPRGAEPIGGGAFSTRDGT